jgi:cell division protein FtsA
MSTLRDRHNARDGLKVLSGGRQSLVAAVDLGASKIGCFIMKPDGPKRDDRIIQVAGVAHVQSRGVRGGAIINMDEAAAAIAQAVERAEAMAGVSVSGVVITSAGGQLASHRVSAAIPLSPRPITDQDLYRAIQLAVSQAYFVGRRAIHLLPIAWSIDGAKGVRDPRNMFGRSLSLDLLVVTMSESAFQTLGHCLELVHLQLEGVVAAPFASALGALEDDEMDLGCICIDMGGGSTSVAVFAGGSLVHVDSLTVGGGHVTADIARGLSTTTAGAERIKTLHGSAIASANEDREMIEAPPRGDDPGAGPVVAPRSLLKGIIAPRVEETPASCIAPPMAPVKPSPPRRWRPAAGRPCAPPPIPTPPSSPRPRCGCGIICDGLARPIRLRADPLLTASFQASRPGPRRTKPAEETKTRRARGHHTARLGSRHKAWNDDDGCTSCKTRRLSQSLFVAADALCKTAANLVSVTS